MVNIALLISCLLAGFLLGRSNMVEGDASKVLNQLIIYFFIPVLTLYHVPKIDFQVQLIWLTLTPFLIFLFSFLFFKIVGRFFELDQKTEGALIMTSGIGSTSFVGFPVFEMLYGQEGLSYGIVLSLAGTFLVFNTLGVSTGLYYSGRVSNLKVLLRNILRFPPAIAFIIALFINVLGIEYPESLDFLLLKLSAPFSVLALISIGMEVDFSVGRPLLKNLALGQGFKLLIAPLLIYVLLWHLLEMRGVLARVCILGAAIGSMNAVVHFSGSIRFKAQTSGFDAYYRNPSFHPHLILN